MVAGDHLHIIVKLRCSGKGHCKAKQRFMQLLLVTCCGADRDIL